MEVAGSSGEISFSVKAGGGRRVLGRACMKICLQQNREVQEGRGAERLEGGAG